jgi:hypothetical protein
MTTKEVATRLYELCQKNDFKTAQEELYADDASSTESNMQGARETIKGKAAIAAKMVQFQSQVEQMYGGYVKEPTVFGNYFFAEFGMDVKMKNMDRMNMVEMARYEVKDGKVISEEFFY